jgi:hypothetical protein
MFPFEVPGTVRIDGTTTPKMRELAIQLQGQARTAVAKPKDDGSRLFERVPPDAPLTMVLGVPTGSHRSAPVHERATTGDAGHSFIKGLAPGSDRIYAWGTVDTNAVVYDPDFLRLNATDGQTVEVPQ